MSQNPGEPTLQEYIAARLLEGIRDLPGTGGFPIMRGDEQAADPRCALCGEADSVHSIAGCERKLEAWEPTGLLPPS